jgi:hypothetical protein
MMTFVVRPTRDEAGRITGVVERVGTGLKARVEDLDAVGRAIGEMIASRGLTKTRARLRRGVAMTRRRTGFQAAGRAAQARKGPAERGAQWDEASVSREAAQEIPDVLHSETAVSEMMKGAPRCANDTCY